MLLYWAIHFQSLFILYVSTAKSVLYFISLPSMLHAALRIHMSDSTADILTKLGGYHIEKRGERQVKVCNITEIWAWAFTAFRSYTMCLYSDVYSMFHIPKNAWDEERGSKDLTQIVQITIMSIYAPFPNTHLSTGQGYNDNILAENPGWFQPSPTQRGDGCLGESARVQVGSLNSHHFIYLLEELIQSGAVL